MTLVPKTKLRKKFGINECELHSIKCFLQGAVYCWTKNLKNKTFAVRDLMGGENSNWQDTPLQCLFEKHKEKGEESAMKEAAKDLGWILKSVLEEDKRVFDSVDAGKTKVYSWVE